MKRILSLALVTLLILTGCGGNANPPVNGDIPTDGTTAAPNTTATPVEGTSAPADVDFDKTDDDMFTSGDTNTAYDGESTVTVTLSDGGIKTSSDAARVSGKTVTLTEAVTYIISGNISDAMIVVNAKKDSELRIVLDGASITSKSCAPLYILKAGKVTLTLADGSENTLANGGSFTQIDDNNINAALYSKCDLTINGTGKLTVTSPAGHGISCKDDLVITGGVYNIVSSSHGIDANDSIRLKGAEVMIDAGKDGIHAENADDAALGYVYISDGKYKIEAEGDGISASATLQIEDGEYDIITGGGSVNAAKKTSDSFGGFMGGRPGKPGQPDQPGQTSSSATEDSESIKGIKAATGLLISGGSFKIDSADDAVHSNANLTVNGGSFDIATGDDGFHADETLTVTAGKIDITKSYEALEGLHVKISGGDISAVSTDDGINAAGGADQSGFGGVRGDMFGGGMGGKGGMGGMSSGNGSIVISGGTVYIESSGDGIDANGTLEITGGHVTVCGPTSGDTATLDYDRSATITGGTFVGTGARNMAQTFSSASQGLISLSVGSFYSGTKITLTDKDGNILLDYTPALNFQIFIFSSPELVSGESYTLTIGSESTTVTAD